MGLSFGKEGILAFRNSLALSGKAFIDGKSTDVLSGETFGCISPRNDMTIAREEIFGPVRRSSPSGTTRKPCGWPTACPMALRRRSRRGICRGDATVPFGSYRQSGNGRGKSLHALDKYTELKTTWIEL